MRSLWGYIEHILAALRGRDGLKTNGQPVTPGEARPASPPEVSAPTEASPALARRGGSRPARPRGRYKALVRFHLTEYRVKVRRWRRSMSGIAYELRSGDGSVKRMIEAPLPRGPMSAAVFLHEIGHHAIGFNRYKPRCLEEYHAWAWALAAMERHGVSVTDRVRQRVHASLHYAIAKATRRGLKVIPPELRPYTTWPPPVRSSRRAARSVTGRA